LSIPQVATGSSEIWDLRIGRRVARFKVNSLNNQDFWAQVSPNGEILAVPGFNRVELYRNRDWKQPYMVLQREGDNTELLWTNIQFSSDSRSIIVEEIKRSELIDLVKAKVGFFNLNLVQFDLDTGKKSTHFSLKSNQEYDVGSKGETIATFDKNSYGSIPSTVDIFNTISGNLQQKLTIPFERLDDSIALLFTNSEHLLFWESWNLPHCWDLQSGENTSINVRGPHKMAVSTDGNLVALRDGISRLFLYFVQENRLEMVQLFPGKTPILGYQITSLAFSGDNETLGLMEYFEKGDIKDQSVFSTYSVSDLIKSVKPR